MIELFGMAEKDLIVNGIVVLAILIFAGVLWITGKKKEVKMMLYVLVKAAEEKFTKGENREKLMYVLEKIDSQIPLLLRMFFNKIVIMNWIDRMLIILKKELQDGSEISAQFLAERAVNLFHDTLITTQDERDGNPYSVTNRQITEIKQNITAELFGNVKTDFKTTTAEAGAKIKLDLGI